MARPSGRPLREEILATARPLIQRVGVDGFSFSDIATQLDVKAPSIHHHFASKADLVAAVAERYRGDFADRVAEIDEGTATDRLLAYADLFDAPASKGLLCLCGSLAAEWPTIMDAARREVETFFSEQHAWIVNELRTGAEAGEFTSVADAEELAETLVAALEGSMLVARASGTRGLARRTIATFLRGFDPARR